MPNAIALGMAEELTQRAVRSTSSYENAIDSAPLIFIFRLGDNVDGPFQDSIIVIFYGEAALTTMFAKTTNVSSGRLSTGVIVGNRPNPVRQLPPNRSFSRIHVQRTGVSVSGRWRTHPIGQNASFDGTREETFG